MKTCAAVAFQAGKPLEIVEVDVDGPNIPCGEEFFVEVGFWEVGLARAVGQALWTCM